MSLDWHQHLYYFDGKTDFLYYKGKSVAMSTSQRKQIRTWAVKHTDLATVKTPFFLYNGSHNIDFPDVEVKPNTSFFFFEPLTYYGANGLIDHIYRADNWNDVRAYEIDSVCKFVKDKSVNIYLTDNYSIEHFKKIYSRDFLYYDPYFHAEATRLNVLGKYLPHSYYTNKIKKSLWCGTWRYDPVRHYILADLVNNKLHINNNFSWFYYVDDIKEIQWTPFPNHVLKGIDKLNSIGPLNIDTSVDKLIHYKQSYPTELQKTKDPSNAYLECFCALVIESRVAQPFVNLSEKTLHAVKNKRPFLLYAAPRSLETLQEAGLKTFGDYWDERYDTITDTKTRIDAINKIAIRLSKLNVDELRYMYNDMKHILNHNMRVIQKIHKLC